MAVAISGGKVFVNAGAVCKTCCDDPEPGYESCQDVGCLENCGAAFTAVWEGITIDIWAKAGGPCEFLCTPPAFSGTIDLVHQQVCNYSTDAVVAGSTSCPGVASWTILHDALITCNTFNRYMQLNIGIGFQQGIQFFGWATVQYRATWKDGLIRCLPVGEPLPFHDITGSYNTGFGGCPFVINDPGTAMILPA